MIQVNNVNMVLVKNIYDSDSESDSAGIFAFFFQNFDIWDHQGGGKKAKNGLK